MITRTRAILGRDIPNIKLVAWFIGLNVLDATLTQIGLMYAGGHEGHPVLRVLIEQSWGLFWVFKIGLVIAISMLFLHFVGRYPRLRRLFVFGIGLLTAVCIVNTIALF